MNNFLSLSDLLNCYFLERHVHISLKLLKSFQLSCMKSSNKHSFDFNKYITNKNVLHSSFESENFVESLSS